MNKWEARPIKENPYSKIIEQMRRQGGSNKSPSIQIGRVVSPNPLVIQIGELQIDGDNILIADYLLGHYTRTANIKGGNTRGTTSTVDGHSHSLASWETDKANLSFSSTLRKNDVLAVMATDDRQTYIVLTRLVNG